MAEIYSLPNGIKFTMVNRGLNYVKAVFFNLALVATATKTDKRSKAVLVEGSGTETLT
jgi:hypothetical protein